VLAARRARIHKGLGEIRIERAAVAGIEDAHPGGVLTAGVDVGLGALTPGDVVVEFVVGLRDVAGAIRQPAAVALVPAGPRGDGVQRFEGAWAVPATGLYGWGLRVRPRIAGEERPSFHDPVAWA
jgi:starch phosphorylase